MYLLTYFSCIPTQAWRNQARVPVNARTCKHLRSILGDAYEEARLKLKNPDGPLPSSGKKGKATNAKRKKGKDDDEEEMDSRKAKSTKTRASTKPKSKPDNGAENFDEVESEASHPVSGGQKPNPLLAVKWDLEKGPDPTGWWVSEKLDGVRYVVFCKHRNDDLLKVIMTYPVFTTMGLICSVD